MALQFTSVEEPSFSRGIDARSAENQIKDGFVRDLVNADIVEGRVTKRKGYEAFAGNIPLRVVRYQQPAVGKAIISLDSSIDLSRVTSRPILVYGRSTTGSSPTGNPFSTTADTALWFTSWATNLRKYFSAGTVGTITASPVEHAIPTQEMYIGVSQNTNANTDILDGELLLTSMQVAADRTITVNYSNNTASQVPVFLYYLDRTDEAGTTYSDIRTTTALTDTWNISATSHQLSTANIIYQLYQQSGTDWILCKPQAVYTSSAGDVRIVNTAYPVGTVLKVVLSSIPDSQSEEGQDGHVLTGRPNSYLFYNCYEPLDASDPNYAEGYRNAEILPETVTYSDVNKTISFDFSGPNVPANIKFNYEQGVIRTNEIYLTDNRFTTSLSADNSPQMTLYGIGHDIAYGDEKRNFRRGWVNHIDSYRSPSSTHMVAGLGGNLFSARSGDDAPAAMSSAMPTYYPNLRARISGEQYIGPAFAADSAASSSQRTRGVYSFTGSNTGWAEVTKAEWSSTGIKYTLETPNRAVTPTKTPIAVGDYLTLKGMPFSRHNGTFKVTVIDISDPDKIVLTVDNPNVPSSDYNDDGCSGSGGIFSDRFTSDTNPNPFLGGDRLLSSSWGNETELYVSDYNEVSTSSTVHLVGCYDKIKLGSNLLITGERISDTVRFRTVANTTKVDYLVPGDTVSYSEQDNLLQIVSIDTTNKTVTFDSTITWRDSVTLPPTFTVAHRWLPVEAPTPDVVDTLIPSTSVRYFTSDDYDNQSFLRSAMVQNNLYLTNGKDEVYKYDGTNNYRAGVIPWQPGLFATVEQSVDSSGIPLVSFTPVIVQALSGNKLEVTKTDSLKFNVGDTYLFSNAGGIKQYLTLISNVEKDNSSHYLTFKEVLQFTTLGTSPTLTLVFFARYYFRLNIKDVNGVTTASAVTGAEDFVVNIAPTTTSPNKVHLRLVGMPAWDQYDFRNKNIEVEIYRTFWSTTSLGEVPTFYRLPQTKACSFVPAGGYIDIVDTYSNDVLSEGDLVVGALSPSTIPAAWDEPPRGKYVTTAGNRLVLANITDWPTLAISYLSSSTVPYTAFNGQKFSFYKDADLTSDTATDMIGTVTYELTTSAGKAVSAINTATVGQFTITTAATDRTIVTGDWVYLYFTTTGSHPLSVSGWWQVFSTNGSTSHTIKVASTPAAVDLVTHPVNAVFSSSATNKDVPVYIGTDYNMGMVNGQVVGFSAPEIRIVRRLGMAINATMRMTDISIPAYVSFKPWLVARSESDTGGQLIVKQPRAEVVLPAVKVLSTISGAGTYVNGNLITTTTAVPASITRYPSRLAVSYDNYPEIFDNLWAVNADDSDSILDINSSDGQEITGVIPFFGESAFGAAMQSGVLVVFKQNSIYLVDLAAKAAGQNPVQRLQTQGLGCTAPYSIAPTKNGIVFANESGIYALRTNQTIEYLGRFMERNWQEKVDLGALSIAQGHHYGVGRQYKLSVPMAADSSDTYAENGEVYVYNHTGEADGELGGWSRYTNHPVTGWANLFQNAFLATANGSVMRVRSSGGVSDYRDGNVAIEAVLEARAVSFGNTGIRKTVSNIVINYRSGANSTSTYVYTSPDLFNDYTLSTLFRVLTKGIPDGLSSKAGQAVVSVLHSIGRRRCIYMSVKIVNSALDENVEIAGMSYVVSGLTSAGIKQAAET